MGTFNSIDGVGYFDPEGLIVKHEPYYHSRIPEYEFVSRRIIFESGEECYVARAEWISIC